MVLKPSNSILNRVVLSLYHANLHKTVSLPAVVVVGKQSSGKSSVLEALSTLQFPADDGMCTRFVTRFEMERSVDYRLTATIEPHSERPTDDPLRKQFSSFAPSIDSLDDFGDLVRSAGELMGASLTKGFMKDTLVVRVSSPTLLAFTLIDVPGLIDNVRNGQPESDIRHIEDVVLSFMKNERVINLAVVAATEDLENQRVLRLVKRTDPKGQRTMGVITKPDASELRPVLQKEYVKILAGEGDPQYRFRLGWHALRNRTAMETHFDRARRDVEEARYLAKSPWSKVKEGSKGAPNLGRRLENDIFVTFSLSLPRLKAEIKTKIQEQQAKIASRGARARSLPESRAEFQQLLEGIQAQVLKHVRQSRRSNTWFGETLEGLAQDFGEIMSAYGHRFAYDTAYLVRHPPTPRPSFTIHMKWHVNEPLPAHELQKHAEAVVAQENAYEGQVSKLIVSRLFDEQVRPWPELLNQYIEKVKSAFGTLLLDACGELAPEDIVAEIDEVALSVQAESFAATLLAASRKETRPPEKVGGRDELEAMKKSWQAKAQGVGARRLRAAYSIGKKAVSSQLVKKDCDTVLGEFRKEGVDAKGFVARQVIAVMQLQYVVGLVPGITELVDQADRVTQQRILELTRAWNEDCIYGAMESFFENFAQEATISVTDDDLVAIYGGEEGDDEAVLEMKQQLKLYGEYLETIEDLAPPSSDDDEL